MANKKESCELILGGLQTFAEGALRHRAHLQFFLFMHLKSIIFQPVSYKTEASTDSRSRDQKSSLSRVHTAVKATGHTCTSFDLRRLKSVPVSLDDPCTAISIDSVSSSVKIIKSYNRRLLCHTKLPPNRRPLDWSR